MSAGDLLGLCAGYRVHFLPVGGFSGCARVFVWIIVLAFGVFGTVVGSLCGLFTSLFGPFGTLFWLLCGLLCWGFGTLFGLLWIGLLVLGVSVAVGGTVV